MGSLDDVIKSVENQYEELIEQDVLTIRPKTETDRLNSVTISITKQKTIPQAVASKLGLRSNGISEDEAKQLQREIREIGEEHGFVERPHVSSEGSLVFRIEDE